MASGPVVRRGRERGGGKARATLLLGAMVATFCVPASFAEPVAAVAAASTSAACKQWQIGGTWDTQTLPFHPVFELTQDGETIGGTETFLPADAAAAQLPNPTAKVSGTLKGDQIDIIATFLGVPKAGKRPAGTLRSEYKGTITTGGVSGTGQDISTPGGPVEWTGTGPATCADGNRYIWTASSISVFSDVRVWLPELPKGGYTPYRLVSVDVSTFGLFSTDTDDKLGTVQGKITLLGRYHRVADTGAAAQAPAIVDRTLTLVVSSGKSFTPPVGSAKRGGSLTAGATVEVDTLTGCKTDQPATLILDDQGKQSQLNLRAGETCMAGGKLQKIGVVEASDPVLLDSDHFKAFTVVIRKRA
jgi:hypothetical protein